MDLLFIRKIEFPHGGTETREENNENRNILCGS